MSTKSLTIGSYSIDRSTATREGFIAVLGFAVLGAIAGVGFAGSISGPETALAIGTITLAVVAARQFIRYAVGADGLTGYAGRWFFTGVFGAALATLAILALSFVFPGGTELSGRVLGAVYVLMLFFAGPFATVALAVEFVDAVVRSRRAN